MRAETPTPSRRKAALFVLVFEVVNLPRREVYVGTADRMPSGLMEAHLLSPRLRHWLQTESLEVRLIEPRLPAEARETFIHAYAESVGRSGWTVITDP